MIAIKFSTATNLGNWMFQYAAARSLDDEVLFCGVGDADVERFAPYRNSLFKNAGIVHTVDVDATYVEPSFHHRPIPYSRDVRLMLQGSFQSEKYFDKALMRKLFAPSEELVGHLMTKYGDWLNSPGVTGISVRRGDYLRLPERHPFVGTGYLRRAMRKFPPSTKFIVCSDDIAWCKRFFKGENFLFVEGESVLAQLYVHALCVNNIISNSSFSWWGAWLNTHPDKVVIAPKKWFGWALRKFDTHDLLWPGVIKEDNHLPLVLWGRALLNITCGWLRVRFPNGYKFYRKAREFRK